MSDEQRHSEAEAPVIVADDEARARRESENALRQFDHVLDLIDDVARGARPFRLRVSTIQDLHRYALDGLSAYAGNWRPGGVTISLSEHKPPAAHLVAGLMEEMCDWINDRRDKGTALELCAYAMWRLNWIHPFDDGNGRTSRAVAYFVLCGSLGYRLGGQLTIPEQIAADKPPYYAALEVADRAFASGTTDVSVLEDLLKMQLARQLVETLDDATTAQTAQQRDRQLH